MENDNISKAGQPVIADTSDVVQASVPDVSQGFPDPLNPPADAVTPDPNVSPDAVGSPEAPTEPTSPEDGTKPPIETPEAPEAATERLKQTNAQNAKLLSALGIDPLSDIAEQLEKGLITPEMVQAHVAAKYQPKPAPVGPTTTAPSNDPVAQAEAEQKAALEAYNKEVSDSGGVSLETNQRLRAADNKVNDARLDKLSAQIAADKHKEQVDESVEAVVNIARTTPEFANMSVDLQKDTEQVSIAFTGMLADQQARAMGLNPATLNAEQYSYFANEANKKLAGLGEFYRNLGRNEAKANFQPPPNLPSGNPNQPTPVPANSTGAPIPSTNPYAQVNSFNHAEAAKDYMAKNKGVM